MQVGERPERVLKPRTFRARNKEVRRTFGGMFPGEAVRTHKPFRFDKLHNYKNKK